jgi:hypothetical protein
VFVTEIRSIGKGRAYATGVEFILEGIYIVRSESNPLEG